MSGGKLKLEIYHIQQLDKKRQCLELLQIGSLDMAKVSVRVLENFAPKMKVLGLLSSMSMSRALSYENIPQVISTARLALSANPIVILLIINLLLLFVGFFKNMIPAY